MSTKAISASTAIPGSLVNEEHAAAILGITPGTLAVWRCTKRYDLNYVRVGRAIRYKIADLERFIESRTVGVVEAE
jgi:hypothetical protein